MSTVSSAALSSLKALPSPASDVKNASSGDDFEKYLKANISGDGATEVSEEELFAAAVPQCLKEAKGAEAVEKFTAEFTKQKDGLKKSDGYVPYEDAAKNALKALVDAQVLTEEEADKVYSQSFAAAQLDGNTNALYDDRGGASDPTKAVAALEQALLGARTKMTSYLDGSGSFDSRKLSEATLTKTDIMGSPGLLGGTPAATGTPSAGSFTPSGTDFSENNGFLFKPEAGDGRLAVLSPDLIGPLVDTIALKDSNGNKLEEGHFTSYGDDGKNRAKYSFSKAGSAYPKDLTVEITYKDGTVQTYSIPDPSKRYE